MAEPKKTDASAMEGESSTPSGVNRQSLEKMMPTHVNGNEDLMNRLRAFIPKFRSANDLLLTQGKNQDIHHGKGSVASGQTKTSTENLRLRPLQLDADLHLEDESDEDNDND